MSSFKKTVLLLTSVLLLISLSYMARPTGSHQSVDSFFENEARNEGIQTAQLPLSFSHYGGFYPEPFDLVMTTFSDAYSVYYTLDGSIPDPTSNPDQTFLYSTPLIIKDKSSRPNVLSKIPTNFENSRNTWIPPIGPVAKGTVVRSVVFDDDEAISSVYTHTYFIFENPYSFPVISLAVDADDFFSDENGIYVPGIHYDEEASSPMMTGNYFQRGSEWEVKGAIEFFEPSGQLAFNQDVGFRIHGGSSRMEPQKAIRVYARSDYGTSQIRYPLFPDSELDVFKRLILRASGNEWGNTMFQDALVHSLLLDLRMDVQLSRPSVVFINGEYWGIHNIRERFDPWYLETNYGVNTDDVVILYGFVPRVSDGTTEDTLHYQQMLDFMGDNDMSNPSVYAHINTLMDIENYVDYQVSQIFFANIDWPQNNIDFWRKRTEKYEPNAPYGHDGRWRWFFYDLDSAFGYWGTTPETRSLFMASDPNYNHNGHWGADFWHSSTFLFRTLLENPIFKNQFINTFADHLNSTLSEERVLRQIDLFQNMYEPEIETHIHRWGEPKNKIEWTDNIEVLRAFASKRPSIIRAHLLEKFELEDTIELQITAPENWVGSIEINDHLVLTHDQLPWSGIYFKEVPITVEYKAQRGPTNKLFLPLSTDEKVKILVIE